MTKHTLKILRCEQQVCLTIFKQYAGKGSCMQEIVEILKKNVTNSWNGVPFNCVVCGLENIEILTNIKCPQ